MTFSQKSDVKKHLAQGFKKTRYLTLADPSNPAEKVDEECAAATDSPSTITGEKKLFLVPRLP
jgi:hypothetical protein